VYTLIVIIVASKYIKQKLTIIEANIIIVVMNVKKNINIFKNLNLENVKYVEKILNVTKSQNNGFVLFNVKINGKHNKLDF
jgi:hypothetical protein